MKFDCVVMNPPYQTATRGGSTGSGHTLWDKFIPFSMNGLKENGFLCSVNPSAWRGNGSHKKIGDLFRENNLIFVEIHNIKDGLKTFKAATRYDWYIVQKNKNYINTTIIGEDLKKYITDIRNIDFIPNFNIDFVYSLLAKDVEDKVNLIYSSSAYRPEKSNGKMRKLHMSEEKTAEFKFPCVKYISKKDYSIDFRWSNTKDNGHFGIPKVMFGVGSQVGGILIDYHGDYGLCDFVAGIQEDSAEILENIKKALESEKFKEMMKSVQFTTQMYNKNVIALFRKDFWKEFI